VPRVKSTSEKGGYGKGQKTVGSKTKQAKKFENTPLSKTNGVNFLMLAVIPLSRDIETKTQIDKYKERENESGQAAAERRI